MVTTTTTMVAKTHAYVIYQCESSVLHTLQYLLSDSMIGRTTMQLMCLGGPAEKYSERYSVRHAIARQSNSMVYRCCKCGRALPPSMHADLLEL